MHGNLNLFEPLPHLMKPVADDFKDKTIVIFDHNFVVSAASQ